MRVFNEMARTAVECDKGLIESVTDVAGKFKCSNEGDARRWKMGTLPTSINVQSIQVHIQDRRFG